MDADGLYGLPLDEFTAARTALARSLRQEGDREGAAAVAALRKPTLVAWAANQLARRYPREVDLLLDASHRLIAAQTGARATDDVARAAGRQRDAIGGLVARAEEILGSRAAPATLTRLSETLRAASLTEEGRERLARGILERELATTGWEILVAAPPAARAGGGAAPRAGDGAAARKRRLALARAAVRDARRRVADAERRLREAEAERERVEQLLAAAANTESEARSALRAAEESLAEAESRLADAEAR